MAQWASKLWQNLHTKDVFKQWLPAGVVTGVFYRSGVSNDEPLLEYLQKVFEERGGEINKRFVLTCVDANSMSNIVFDENNQHIPKAAVSSSSIPAAFPTRHWAADLTT